MFSRKAAAGHTVVRLGVSHAVGGMRDVFVGWRHFHIRWQGAQERVGELLSEAADHRLWARFRFGNAASTDTGDRVREGEGADAAVQRSHLTARAWSGRKRSAMKEGKERRA